MVMGFLGIDMGTIILTSRETYFEHNVQPVVSHVQNCVCGSKITVNNGISLRILHEKLIKTISPFLLLNT